MNMRFLCGIAAGKTVLWACRLLRLGGTTLPGKIALLVCPDLLSKLSKGCMIIVVTGTNGKTTTSRIISRILDECGIPHLANRSGANLLSGVTSIFLEHSSLFGRRDCDTAVIEIDEAAVRIVCDHIEPRVITVTNFFRDQLDRYGELYTTVANVKAALVKRSEATAVINADDSLCVSLTGVQASGSFSGETKTVFYGVEKGPGIQLSDNIENNDTSDSDAPFCIRCKGAYTYDYRTYGHLGGFRCPSCGFSRPSTDIWCEPPISFDISGSRFTLRIKDDDTRYEANIPLPALYNIYNALAAAAAGFASGLPIPSILEGLRSFECGFGRMEQINAGDKTIKLILVKNPTGFNQVIDFLSAGIGVSNVVFMLNDRIADGTDVSWIWDVDFEKYATTAVKPDIVYASGDRAEDMALRLKYAGIPQENISIIKDHTELLRTALEKTDPGGVLYLLPTYTAMLDIRKMLQSHFDLKEFWE